MQQKTNRQYYKEQLEGISDYKLADLHLPTVFQLLLIMKDITVSFLTGSLDNPKTDKMSGIIDGPLMQKPPEPEAPMKGYGNRRYVSADDEQALLQELAKLYAAEKKKNKDIAFLITDFEGVKYGFGDIQCQES